MNLEKAIKAYIPMTETAYYILLSLTLQILSGLVNGGFWMTVPMYTFLVVEFGAFAIRTILYYFRVKKSLKNR